MVSPDFLLLDEPFAGIDPIAVLEIQAIARRLASSGIGVLVTDHNVRETLSIVDRAYIIHDGEILTGGHAACSVERRRRKKDLSRGGVSAELKRMI